MQVSENFLNAINSHLVENTVIITDVFNVYTEVQEDVKFEKYNFIINDDDTVTYYIFNKLVKHINSVDVESDLKKVFVNPAYIYSGSISIFIKPPKFKLTGNDNVKIIKLLKFPYNELSIDDKVGMKRVALNMVSLENIYIDKIWIYNPALSIKENTDILMQKLMGGPASVTSSTYNTLLPEIISYKSFKLLDIEEYKLYTPDCSNASYSHSMFGFDLTKWPN